MDIPSTLSSSNWSTVQKIAFRLCFLYFLLFIIFTPNSELPVVTSIYSYFEDLLHIFIPRFARTVLGHKQELYMGPSGSGDTTYYYMLWFLTLILTVIGTILWSLLDRKRKNYDTLYYWIRVMVRYYLFYTMVIYGVYKVIKLQFPAPSLTRLVQPYGDSSPMGLAWTYMGYSKTYNYFTGIAELLGGFLLLSRKTTTIGALVCLGVMTNVFLINMSFDVPVKLLSFNTILMSVFLLWKDGKRMVAFFLQNKAVPASDIAVPYQSRRSKIILVTLKWVFIVFVTVTNIIQALQAEKQYGAKAPKPPLHGIYYTEEFVRNNQQVAPLTTDTTRWQRIIISSGSYASVQLMNDSTQWYTLKLDTVAHKAELRHTRDTTIKAAFNYSFRQPYLEFNGLIKTDSVRIRLKRFDEKNFLLMNRGFHWVSELPFNR